MRLVETLADLAIAIAWALAIYAIVMALVGASTRRRDFIASADHAVLTVWGMVVIAVAALLHALVTHDFNVEYVAHYSSSTLPLYYSVAALWGGGGAGYLLVHGMGVPGSRLVVGGEKKKE